MASTDGNSFHTHIAQHVHAGNVERAETTMRYVIALQQALRRTMRTHAVRSLDLSITQPLDSLSHTMTRKFELYFGLLMHQSKRIKLAEQTTYTADHFADVITPPYNVHFWRDDDSDAAKIYPSACSRANIALIAEIRLMLFMVMVDSCDQLAVLKLRGCADPIDPMCDGGAHIVYDEAVRAIRNMPDGEQKQARGEALDAAVALAEKKCDAFMHRSVQVTRVKMCRRYERNQQRWW